MSDNCPSESAHDFVVTQMHAGKGLMCLYTVECSRCGERRGGYADDIPPARF